MTRRAVIAHPAQAGGGGSGKVAPALEHRSGSWRGRSGRRARDGCPVLYGPSLGKDAAPGHPPVPASVLVRLSWCFCPAPLDGDGLAGHFAGAFGNSCVSERERGVVES